MTRLRKKRLQLKMSQQQLAVAVGITQPNICTMEKNGVKRIDIAKRCAVALNCNPLEILEL